MQTVPFVPIKKQFRLEILKSLRSYPILTEDSEPFIVSPDFLGKNLGAVLEQYQDGLKRFIAAAGRKLTLRESNYLPT